MVVEVGDGRRRKSCGVCVFVRLLPRERVIVMLYRWEFLLCIGPPSFPPPPPSPPLLSLYLIIITFLRCHAMQPQESLSIRAVWTQTYLHEGLLVVCGGGVCMYVMLRLLQASKTGVGWGGSSLFYYLFLVVKLFPRKPQIYKYI